MGDPAMRPSDSTVTPPNPTIPFLPQTTHPTTSDVEQMINTRVQNVVEHLRAEFSGRTPNEQRNREIVIGVVGAATGVLVYVGGKWVVNKIRMAGG